MFSWCKTFLLGAVASIILSIAPVSSACQSSHPAKRIVSLAPDLTELLFAVGAGDAIVGVMRGSDYPQAALRIPVIAMYNHVNPEAILALQPDLVVVGNSLNLQMQLAFLQTFHIPVYVSHQRKLADIPRIMRDLGCLTGNEKKAEQAAHAFLSEYESIRKKYADRKSVSVFYQMWDRPLITVNEATMINEVIELCGGKNLFAKLKVEAPEVNLEAVIQAKPEVIIGSRVKTFWKIWKNIPAVQHQLLIEIQPELLERATPRILIGATQICTQMPPLS